jgi:hypothetical protein
MQNPIRVHNLGPANEPIISFRHSLVAELIWIIEISKEARGQNP